MKKNKYMNNEQRNYICNSLLESIQHNDDAIDYMQNRIYRTENVLNYLPEDEETFELLQIEKFIKFELEFIGKQYKESLKSMGVNI